jgi:hypothetical protein
LVGWANEQASFTAKQAVSMVQAAMKAGKDNPMAKKTATKSRKANPAAKKAAAARHTNAKEFAPKGETLKKAKAKGAANKPAVAKTSGDVLTPSPSVAPSIGRRQAATHDGGQYLYLMTLKGDLSAMMGRSWHSLVGKGLVKVGYSKDPIRLCEELNSAFPPVGQFEWRLATSSKKFRDGASAKAAEAHLKAEFDRAFESLGGEFFFGSESRIESAFDRIAGR